VTGGEHLEVRPRVQTTHPAHALQGLRHQDARRGSGVIVYEEAGYLHLLEPDGGKDTQLAITCRGDLPWAEARWLDASKWIESASLSPSGARALFSARGEVFSVPAEKGDARNLTRSSGRRSARRFGRPMASRSPGFRRERRVSPHDRDAGGLSAPREIKFEQPTFYHTAIGRPTGSTSPSRTKG